MTYKILSDQNYKQRNAKEHGYYAMTMFLEPNYTDPGTKENTCPGSGLCAAVCLSKAGRNKYDKAKNARLRRTKLFFENRSEFYIQLITEIDSAVAHAQKRNLKLAIRLNGLSDIAFEDDYPELFQRFPSVTFYDYTKILTRLRPGLLKKRGGWILNNYHLTYSFNEKVSSEAMTSMLAFKVNVACIVPVQPTHTNVAVIKNTTGEHRVWMINGDESDLRFLDKPGCVVTLKFKQVYEPNTGYKISEQVIEKCQRFLFPEILHEAN